MDAFILSQEVPLRLGVFFGIFAAMAPWESLAPRRALQQHKPLRWSNNLALIVLNGIVVRAILPVTALGVAGMAAERGMGALNILQVPHPWAIVLGVLALDLAIYLQHLMFHAVPLLWRQHRVHHSVDPRETNSNFGFSLPWWDYLFGTYLAQPRAGHTAMTFGVEQFRNPRDLWLARMLWQPFRADAGGYTIGREPATAHEFRGRGSDHPLLRTENE